jgi:hypothetical protein
MKVAKSNSNFYIQLTNSQKIVFALLLVVFLTIAARGLAVFGIGYQTDDYWNYVFDSTIKDKGWLIYMGRFVWWLLHEVILIFGSSPVGAANLFAFLYCAALVYAGCVCCEVWGVVTRPIPVFIIVLCIAANPFLADSFSYRMSYPFMACAIFLSHLSIKQSCGSVWRLSFYGVLLGAAIGIYQIVIPITLAILLGQFLIWLSQNPSKISSWNLFIRENASLFWRFGVFFLGISLYLLVSKLLSIMLGTQSSATSLINIENLPQRIIEFARVLNYDIRYQVPLLQPIAKISFFALVLLSFFIFTKKSYQDNGKIFAKFFSITIFLSTLAGLFFTMYALQFISETGFRESQRLYITSGWIIGAILALLCFQRDKTLRLTLILGLVIGVSGLMVNNKVLSDQARMNQRDILLAGRIIDRMEKLFDINTIKTVVVLGGWREYPAKFQTSHWQLNNSAVSEPWSKTQFLTEFSGYRFDNPSKDQFIQAKISAIEMPEWPAEGSIQAVGDLAIVKLPVRQGAREYDHY